MNQLFSVWEGKIEAKLGNALDVVEQDIVKVIYVVFKGELGVYPSTK